MLNEEKLGEENDLDKFNNDVNEDIIKDDVNKSKEKKKKKVQFSNNNETIYYEKDESENSYFNFTLNNFNYFECFYNDIYGDHFNDQIIRNNQYNENNEELENLKQMYQKITLDYKTIERRFNNLIDLTQKLTNEYKNVYFLTKREFEALCKKLEEYKENVDIHWQLKWMNGVDNNVYGPYNYYDIYNFITTGLVTVLNPILLRRINNKNEVLENIWQMYDAVNYLIFVTNDNIKKKRKHDGLISKNKDQDSDNNEEDNENNKNTDVDGDDDDDEDGDDQNDKGENIENNINDEDNKSEEINHKNNNCNNNKNNNCSNNKNTILNGINNINNNDNNNNTTNLKKKKKKKKKKNIDHSIYNNEQVSKNMVSLKKSGNNKNNIDDLKRNITNDNFKREKFHQSFNEDPSFEINNIHTAILNAEERTIHYSKDYFGYDIEPFNMKNELTQGYIDKDGNYIYNESDNDEVEEAWLKSVDEQDPLSTFSNNTLQAQKFQETQSKFHMTYDKLNNNILSINIFDALYSLSCLLIDEKETPIKAMIRYKNDLKVCKNYLNQYESKIDKINSLSINSNAEQKIQSTEEHEQNGETLQTDSKKTLMW
ncbi:hypothetical protein PFTANZ_03082 [Plasmodium falciparum Tanzania (2000708)]|uniref:GYF domain-containing protein n=1 Tax=Plasmodium falciparum Tanzania (2000708) TaxID=1036725 RepID=A0A024W6W7_PLAFA|nr:hypothetical protein PFTANZ_03082 [Plasmodium falciparum Tanzania (2000708)]